MGGRQRLRRKEKVTKKLDREQVKRGGGEKKDRKWSKWMGGENRKYMEITKQFLNLSPRNNQLCY